MSAILGLLDLSGRPIHPDVFNTCFAKLDHYGLDGSGRLIEDNLCMGLQHTGISQSAAVPPEIPELQNRLFVADAIVDNRTELLAKLGKSDSPSATQSEVHLIAHAYNKWGLGATDHLSGDYAIAIFDRAEKRLTLIRDHLGTRPLYWSRQGDLIIFATNLRAIISCTLFDWQIDEPVVARHLMGPPRPPLKTFFKGLHSVSPGSVLTIDAGGISEKRWWNPHDLPAVRHKSRSDYVAHFRDILDAVALDYTDTDKPVGAHLSGGIDSGTVAAFAADALRKRGTNLTAAYTWAPPVNDDFPLVLKRDERHNVLKISERFGFPVRFGGATGKIHRDYLAMDFELDGLADLSDEIAVLRNAHTDGLRVMLSGWGGDEAFSAHGIGYLAYTLKRFQLPEMYRVLKFQAGVKRFRPKRIGKALMQWGLGPMLPDWLYLRTNPYVNLYAGGAFISDELSRLEPDIARWNGEDIRMISDPIRYLANLFLMGHLNMRMETWAAWSAQHGFQYRYPLLDRRIVEFVLGMPPSLMFGDGSSRYLAKSAVKDMLPENLTKHDQANESLRTQCRFDCIQILKNEMAAGRFDTPSAWLNLDDLKTALRNFENEEVSERAAVAKLYAAMRVWHMEQRWS